MFCFKQQLENLGDANVLVRGASRVWTTRQVFSLARQLRAEVEQLCQLQRNLQRRCLLLCDGAAFDTVVYLAAVIAGISVAPYSPTAFRKDPHHVINSLKPCLIVTPRRLHTDLSGISTGMVISSRELAGACDDLTKPEFDFLEKWFIGDDQEAYVISTSGSTGCPKFVPITYRNIFAWVRSGLPALRLQSSSRFGGTYPLYFDASAMFIFGCLFTGCTLVLPEKEQTLKPLAHAARVGATHWATVPSAWEYSNRVEPELPVCQSAHTVGLGGEVVSPLVAKNFLEVFPNAEIVDLYGPAEATIFIAFNRLSRKQLDLYRGQTSLPLSPPHCPWKLDNSDGSDSKTSFGELLVGGDQVFRGYLQASNRLHATFVDGLLRTGDLFCHENGLLHYKGRTDNQVKIRGQRITLEAIERAIQAGSTTISDACCGLANEPGADIDVLYSGGQVEEGSLEHELRGVLPLRIRIGRLVRVKAIPVTANGKVDRDAAQKILAQRLKHEE